MANYSKFGLNCGCIPVEAQLKSSEKAVWLEVKIGVADDRYPKAIRLFYPNVAVEFKNKQVVRHTSGDKLDAARKTWRSDVAAVLTALAGGTSVSDYANKILAERPKTPSDYITIGLQLLPPDWKENKVDLFLEWGKPNDEGKRYLECPMSSQDGEFICRGTNPGWQENTSDGLVYEKDGRQHPFRRSAGYMKSKKANRGDAVLEAKIAPMKVTPPSDEDVPF